MIDDNGAARLATGVRSSILVTPDTPIAGDVQPGGDTDSHRYSAPELHQPEGRDIGGILMTKESDVYGMGMVILEARSLYNLA